MRKHFLIYALILGISLQVSPLQAAEEEAASIDEDLEYTYGSVVSSSPEQIVVSEYDYEADEEAQTTYIVKAETKFSNINAAADLTKDDNVDIYYKVADGQKVATMVTKDETVYDAQTGEEEDAGEVPEEESVEPQTNSATEVPDTTTGNETRG